MAQKLAGGKRGKEVEGQRQIARSSRKARAPLPASAFAHGNARTATCGLLVGYRHFQKVVSGVLSKRYLLMLVIFEGAYLCLSKEKSWRTNLEYTPNL